MKNHPSPTVPASGPIHLDIDIPATAHTCGVRFRLRLNTRRADTVREAAAKLDMDTLSLIYAVLTSELPTAMPPRSENVALTAKQAGLNFGCDDPAFLARIERVAAYKGFASAEDFLLERFSIDLWSAEADMVVHPQTRQPVGNEAFWTLISDSLERVHCREYTADPLEEPGFLDKYPGRDPLKVLNMVHDDAQLEPSKGCAAAA